MCSFGSLCLCAGQWRTRLTLTSCCWGTCWWGRTCRTWRTWPRRRTMKTTGPSASRTWGACIWGNAGGWRQDVVWLIDWTHLTSYSLTQADAHTFSSFSCFSLLEKHQDVNEADFPLPLAAVDTETEILIIQKDKEVCLSFCRSHLVTRLTRSSPILSSVPLCSWGGCRRCWRGFRGRCSRARKLLPNVP